MSNTYSFNNYKFSPNSTYIISINAVKLMLINKFVLKKKYYIIYTDSNNILHLPFEIKHDTTESELLFLIKNKIQKKNIHFFFEEKKITSFSNQLSKLYDSDYRDRVYKYAVLSYTINKTEFFLSKHEDIYLGLNTITKNMTEGRNLMFAFRRLKLYSYLDLIQNNGKIKEDDTFFATVVYPIQLTVPYRGKKLEVPMLTSTDYNENYILPKDITEDYSNFLGCAYIICKGQKFLILEDYLDIRDVADCCYVIESNDKYVVTLYNEIMLGIFSNYIIPCNLAGSRIIVSMNIFQYTILDYKVNIIPILYEPKFILLYQTDKTLLEFMQTEPIFLFDNRDDLDKFKKNSYFKYKTSNRNNSLTLQDVLEQEKTNNLIYDILENTIHTNIEIYKWSY